MEILDNNKTQRKELETPTVVKVLSVAKELNEFEIGQEVPAQMQTIDLEDNIIGQEPLAQIELIFVNSPIAKINWASHMVLMDNKLPLGIRYWYMKQAVEFGWSSNILDNNTIGLLLCRGKDEIMAQYSLEGYNQPIGVSDYQLSKAVPEELKSALPTIEEVEQELSYLLEQKNKIK